MILQNHDDIRLWKSDPEYYRQLTEWEELWGRQLRLLFITGEITREQYLDFLHQLLEKRNKDDYNAVGYLLTQERLHLYTETYRLLISL